MSYSYNNEPAIQELETVFNEPARKRVKVNTW